MDNHERIKLYTTHPHACSYLEDRQATSLFIDPELSITKDLYSQLSDSGFRRSGEHLYRPHCEGCQACIPARIPVRYFSTNRQQRRCLKRNDDIVIKHTETIDTNTHYQLYERYISGRHQDGDMYPATRQQYDSFLGHHWDFTRYLEFYLDDQLIGVAVTDEMNHGLSAVYTYFDPDFPERSLGTFGILQQIKLAQQLQLSSLYLGYWIKNCQKMAYKSHFRPLELLIQQKWTSLNP